MPQRLPVLVSIYSEDRKALPNFFSIFGISPTKYDNDNSIHRILNEELDSFIPVYHKECKFSKKEFPKLFTSHINSRINSSTSKLEIINGKVDTIRVYKYVAVRRDLYSIYNLWFNNNYDNRRRFNLWEKLLFVGHTKTESKWNVLGSKFSLPSGVLELFNRLESCFLKINTVRIRTSLFRSSSSDESQMLSEYFNSVGNYMISLQPKLRMAKQAISSGDMQVANVILADIRDDIIRCMGHFRNVSVMCSHPRLCAVNGSWWITRTDIMVGAVELFRQLHHALPYAPPEIYLDIGVSPRMYSDDVLSPSTVT